MKKWPSDLGRKKAHKSFPHLLMLNPKGGAVGVCWHTGCYTEWSVIYIPFLLAHLLANSLLLVKTNLAYTSLQRVCLFILMLYQLELCEFWRDYTSSFLVKTIRDSFRSLPFTWNLINANLWPLITCIVCSQIESNKTTRESAYTPEPVRSIQSSQS